MGRPPGQRNLKFEESRSAMLDQIIKAVSAMPHRSSFAELADMAGVSRTTLRHYFGSREALLSALLEHMKVIGDQMRSRYPDPTHLGLEDALRASLSRLVLAWRVGVGALIVSGLVWGLEDEKLGTGFVQAMLEPLLTGFEQQISLRLSASGMSAQQARFAALALVSPLVLALLHQDALHGASCRPLPIEEFMEEHLQRFLKGWCNGQ